MNTTEFWSLIDAAHVDAAGAPDAARDPGAALVAALEERLAATSERTVFEFEQRFDEFHEALYRWDLWAAAYLIAGGCSDDSFIDFRAGLIAQGRDWYERASACPDSLADHPDVVLLAADDGHEVLFNEAANYAAGHAYARITGDEDGFYEAYERFLSEQPEDGTDDADEPRGEDFDFDDDREMHARLPRLAGMFLGDPVG